MIDSADAPRVEADPVASPATPWSDLDRPPLSARRLQAAFDDDSLWRRIVVDRLSASTNIDVLSAAGRGEPEGLVVIAEQQSGGRGRLDRSWQSPARAGVLLSVLLRPRVPPTRLPLLPLLAGLAVAEAVQAVGQVEARLKWPNDVLVDGQKLGGLLVERGAGDAVVVGVGLNVSTRRDELPVPTATSLALVGGGTDREPLVKELLRALQRRYAAFVSAGGAAASVLPAYRERCETIGRRVVVHAPGGRSVSGEARAVDDTGMLVVHTDDGAEQAWSAGDVVHVKAED